MKRLLALHPILFAASSAIIVYVDKADARALIPPQDVILPTLCAMAGSLALILIGMALSRKLEAAGLIASLLVLGLFHLWPVFLAVLGITLFGMALFRLVLKRVSITDANVITLVVSLLLLGFYSYRFLSFAMAQPWKPLPNPLQPLAAQADGTLPAATPPDIYYIILDGYGRADMLKAIHGYDNSAFVTALQQRGFVVAAQSQSNYPRTLLSLASSLNMQYLDSLSSVMDDASLWWPTADTIQHSQLRSFLEQQGYRTVFFGSGWDYTDLRDGDVYLAPYPLMLRDFDKVFIRMNNLRVLGELSWLGISYPSYSMHRRLILFEFQELPEAAALPGPKLVFAHILAPHTPFVFRSNGDPVDPSYPYSIFDARDLIGDLSAYRKSYLEQLTYINQKVLETVDGILAHSPTPPVIILQGDHGPDTFVDYTDPDNSCLYERYSILNAYYLPGVDPQEIPADISPVNSFRLILNQYFGSSLEMLPNHRYFSRDPHTYRFEDVTDLTTLSCKLPEGLRP